MQVGPRTFWLAKTLRTLTKHYQIPQRWREKLCRVVFRPPQTEHFGFSVALGGVIYEGDFSVFQDWRVFFLGTFERETINLLAHVLRSRSDSVFLDVGANKGLFTIALARSCSMVHAFEPYSKVSRLMAKSIERNRLTNVAIHPMALGAEAEEKLYFPPNDYNTGVGSFFREHQNDGSAQPVSLRIVRGDEFLLPLVSRVDAIKIDTEGFEGYVLTGLRETLTRHRPVVVFEMSETTVRTFPRPGDFANLFPENYRFYLISDHTTLHDWGLTALTPERLTQEYGNLLATPVEAIDLVSSRAFVGHASRRTGRRRPPA